MLQDDTNVGSCVSLCACVYRCRNVSSALTEINKQILMVFVDLGFSNELIQPKEWCKTSLKVQVSQQQLVLLWKSHGKNVELKLKVCCCWKIASDVKLRLLSLKKKKGEYSICAVNSNNLMSTTFY